MQTVSPHPIPASQATRMSHQGSEKGPPSLRGRPSFRAPRTNRGAEPGAPIMSLTKTGVSELTLPEPPLHTMNTMAWGGGAGTQLYLETKLVLHSGIFIWMFPTRPDHPTRAPHNQSPLPRVSFCRTGCSSTSSGPAGAPQLVEAKPASAPLSSLGCQRTLG